MGVEGLMKLHSSSLTFAKRTSDLVIFNCPSSHNLWKWKIGVSPIMVAFQLRLPTIFPLNQVYHDYAIIRRPESACSSNNLMQNPNRSVKTKSKIQNPKSEIQNPKSKIQDPKSKIQNPKSEIRNPKSKIQNPKSKIQNPKSKIQDPKSKVQNPKSKIQNPKSKIQTAAFGAAT